MVDAEDLDGDGLSLPALSRPPVEDVVEGDGEESDSEGLSGSLSGAVEDEDESVLGSLDEPDSLAEELEESSSSSRARRAASTARSRLLEELARRGCWTASRAVLGATSSTGAGTTDGAGVGVDEVVESPL